MNRHRTLVLAAALTGAFLLTSCAHTTIPTAAACENGVENRQAPIVCIDDLGDTLKPLPEEIEAHDRRSFWFWRPVVIQWQTASGGGDLRLEFKQDDCVTTPECDGSGRCRAKTKRLAAGEASAQCKYDVWIEGGRQKRLDPTVVIVKCCATQ